jgi:hypothetical protein
MVVVQFGPGNEYQRQLLVTSSVDNDARQYFRSCAVVSSPDLLLSPTLCYETLSTRIALSVNDSMLFGVIPSSVFRSR